MTTTPSRTQLVAELRDATGGRAPLTITITADGGSYTAEQRHRFGDCEALLTSIDLGAAHSAAEARVRKLMAHGWQTA